MTGVASLLVVDDVLENLKLLASMLGDQGYEVRPVTNGRQALLAAERDPPDLILLDINMPEMSGYEVCARLKAHERLQEVPVIFLTALSDVADKVRAFEAGGVDYITKPFQLEEVQVRVRTHVAIRRAQRELAESYARLRELERLRDDLVHMVVHDMRSPLMVMLGHLELLREGTTGLLDQEASQDLLAATGAARTLNGMANDLLDVSRFEDGKFTVTRAEHDIVELLSEVRTAARALDRRRNIELTASGSVPVACDRNLIRRVLENFVSNAIKHTPAGGALTITLSAGERVRVTIADEGPGVPLAARARLFEKFGVVAQPSGEKYHSAGLGLAFCKLAVEAHGGRVGMDALEPHGSAFWFELPA